MYKKFEIDFLGDAIDFMGLTRRKDSEKDIL